jgi:hypothetical protein
MMNVITLTVIKRSVFKLSVFKLSVVKLCAVKLGVFMLRVVTPLSVLPSIGSNYSVIMLSVAFYLLFW